MPGVRFSPEQRTKAVRLVAEARPQHESQWAAIESVASKIGASAETVRKWVRRAEVDAGERPGMTSEEHAEVQRLRREVAELRRGEKISNRAGALFVGARGVCRAGDGVGLPPATYYAAKTRPPSARARRDAELTPVIERVHRDNYGVYRARKMQAALRRDGVDIGRDQTARLMRELGLAGVRRGRIKRTTLGNDTAARPADLVNRDFHAASPDQLWVCDLTYIRTWAGFGYLALVIDVFSRRIVGWALAGHMRTELPLEALELAVWTRQQQRLDGLVHHTDAGSQYLAIRYTDTLTAAGAVASVGSVGDSYDNALAESTIGQIKTN